MDMDFPKHVFVEGLNLHRIRNMILHNKSLWSFMMSLSNCVLGCVGMCVLYVKMRGKFFCNEIGNPLGLCVNSELIKGMESFVKDSTGVC
jgi:hypothetical protein